MTTLGARPRGLPIAPMAPAAKRRLPLADGARDVDRAWRPVYAVWEITLRCDLACRHCGSRAGRARPDELSTAEALDLVRQMAELGVKHVTLIGGEAYLRDDWREIARAIRDRGMVPSMATGARGMTREVARDVRAARFESVGVSVDGLRDTHDALRGVSGSFDAAISGLENLRAEGVVVTVNTQMNRLNLLEIPRVFDDVVLPRAKAWQVQITVAMGRAADEPSILLEPYQMLDVMPMLAGLKPRAEAAGVRILPGSNVGYFGPYESLLRDGYPRGHKGSCAAGRTTLGLEANGDVKGCPSLPTAEFVGGNIRDASLRDIWERAAPLRFTRERTAAELSGFCKDCYYADTCLGGCSWTSTVLFGAPGNNPFCHHRALELLRAGKRERLERTEAPGGMPFDHGRFAIVEEDWPAEELAPARTRAGGAGPLLGGRGGGRDEEPCASTTEFLAEGGLQ